MKKFFKWVGIVLVGLFLLGVIAGMMGGQKDGTTGGATASAEPKKEVVLPLVTANELAHAYDENTVAADQRFKGQRFKVKGTVTDINTNFMGAPVVLMRGGVNQFLEPQFEFDKNAVNQLAALKKGQSVMLECTGRGDVAKTPMSDDCVLVQ